MRVEQRQRIRKKIPMNILVRPESADSKHWRIRDLSLDGVLLEGRNETWAPGTPVEAILALKERDELDLHRVPAYVARVDADGIALRFRDYPDRTYTALVDLLYSS